MQVVRLTTETDFDGWRIAARSLLSQGIAPEDVIWRVGEKNPGLFDSPEYVPMQTQNAQLSVSRDFILLCKTAILYRDPTRFSLLYQLLWRISKEPQLLKIAFDSDVMKVRSMTQAVRRDLHKMKAFVRFREVNINENDQSWSGFVAWFEPSHYIVEASAPFFTERFTNMHWSILTPDLCMHWDGKTLRYSSGATKEEQPKPDAEDKMWRAYYRSIFNPARLKVSAMQAQMPKKYWRNLPEAELIAELVANADKRKDSMIAAEPTEPQRKIVKYVAEKKPDQVKLGTVGESAELDQLNSKMLANEEFTQTEYSDRAVLGSGAVPSDMMLLGEQPNEQEDLAGQSFIGSAGKLLDQALLELGIERSHVYVTNSLKHYKFKLKGTRRVQISPKIGDIATYLPWLQGEIAIVQPRVIVALGTIAARVITGETLDLEANRGSSFYLADGRKVIVTYHPAFILRTSDPATKQLRFAQLVADLKFALQNDEH